MKLYHPYTEDDTNSMFSLENRSPYLDRKLFELCSLFLLIITLIMVMQKHIKRVLLVIYMMM